jgi:hypothetical protein
MAVFHKINAMHLAHFTSQITPTHVLVFLTAMLSTAK